MTSPATAGDPRRALAGGGARRRWPRPRWSGRSRRCPRPSASAPRRRPRSPRRPRRWPRSTAGAAARRSRPRSRCATPRWNSAPSAICGSAMRRRRRAGTTSPAPIAAAMAAGSGCTPISRTTAPACCGCWAARATAPRSARRCATGRASPSSRPPPRPGCASPPCAASRNGTRIRRARRWRACRRCGWSGSARRRRPRCRRSPPGRCRASGCWRRRG